MLGSYGATIRQYFMEIIIFFITMAIIINKLLGFECPGQVRMFNVYIQSKLL